MSTCSAVRRALPALLILLSFVPAAFPQESRGTITGQVTDAGAAVIPKVTVVISNVDTGQSVTLTTNESGSYVAPLLLLGKYRVTAEITGFKRFIREGIELSVNDKLQVDIKLDVGEVTQSITVTEGAPLLDAADASMGQVISGKEVEELPIAHGNPYALIALSPGSSFEGDPKLNRPYEPTHIVGFAMNGTRANTSDITLDGTSNSAGSGGSVTASYVPPVDAVGEFKVQTTPFDAKVGQSMGGVVNISLKSGTNRMHGAAYWSKMSPAMMANDFFANRAGLPRGEFLYDRWGGSLNGPVLLPKIYNGRNRTFYMWAYEGLRDTRPRGRTLTVPTLEQRNGDFSELLNLGSNYQIYNPFTRRPISSTRYQMDPFPRNIIPASLISPVAKNVLKFVSNPVTGGTTADHLNNLPLPNDPEATRYYSHTIRLDHTISDRNRVSGSVAFYKRYSMLSDYFQSPASGTNSQYLSRRAAIDDVYSISPTFIANVRYGYNRYLRISQPLHGRNFDFTTLGFPAYMNAAVAPALREFPFFNISGMFGTINVGEQRSVDTHSFVAAFTKVAGAHTLEFGGEFRAYRSNNYVMSTRQSGDYEFDPTWARGPLDNSPVAPTGQSTASFLMGLPNKNSYLMRNTSFAEQSTVWCGYIMDTWRMTRKLNVTLGIRYEVEGPLTEHYNRSIRGFDPNAAIPQEAAAKAVYAANWAATPTPEMTPDQFKVKGGLLFAGVNGQPRELWDRDGNNFMPRVGLAYSINAKTVFRGGYGIYFGFLGERRMDVIQSGFSRKTAFIPTVDNVTLSSTLSNPYPNGILEPMGPAGGAQTELGNAIEAFNSHPLAPYMQRWQASLQRQLSRDVVVEAAYVGNRGTHLELDRDLNTLGNELLSKSPEFDQARVNYLTATQNNPYFGLPDTGAIGGNAKISREALLKPYSQFGSVTTTTNEGYSWYHSLQARAQKRFSKGMTLTLGYTWARFMEGFEFLNTGDPVPYRSLSPQDRPHRFTASSIYELPFGRRKRFLKSAPRWLDSIAGGWQLQGIYTYQSGAALTWGDAIFFGNGDDIRKSGRNIDQWFNTAAGFTTSSTTRPSYHYRVWPLRFNNIRGDYTNNWDLSAIKKWRITEKLTVQFRGEFLNAFNHARFKNPSTDQFSRSFGQVTDTSGYPRQVQLGLRATF